MYAYLPQALAVVSWITWIGAPRIERITLLCISLLHILGIPNLVWLLKVVYLMVQCIVVYSSWIKLGQIRKLCYFPGN